LESRRNRHPKSWLPHWDRLTQFRVAFVLGDKALAAVRESKLPARMVKMLTEAKKYPEGTAVRLEGADAEDLETIRKPAKAKIEH
jgi:hypothetical protein